MKVFSSVVSSYSRRKHMRLAELFVGRNMVEYICYNNIISSIRNQMYAFILKWMFSSQIRNASFTLHIREHVHGARLQSTCTCPAARENARTQIAVTGLLACEYAAVSVSMSALPASLGALIGVIQFPIEWRQCAAASSESVASANGAHRDASACQCFAAPRRSAAYKTRARLLAC